MRSGRYNIKGVFDRIILTLILASLLLSPLAYAIEDESSATYNIASADTLVDSSFGKVTPISGSNVVNVAEKEPLLQVDKNGHPFYDINWSGAEDDSEIQRVVNGAISKVPLNISNGSIIVCNGSDGTAECPGTMPTYGSGSISVEKNIYAGERVIVNGDVAGANGTLTVTSDCVGGNCAPNTVLNTNVTGADVDMIQIRRNGQTYATHKLSTNNNYIINVNSSAGSAMYMSQDGRVSIGDGPTTLDKFQVFGTIYSTNMQSLINGINYIGLHAGANADQYQTNVLAIGDFAGQNNAHSNVILIGNNATATNNGQLVIGNAAGQPITEAFIGVNANANPLIYANTSGIVVDGTIRGAYGGGWISAGNNGVFISKLFYVGRFPKDVYDSGNYQKMLVTLWGDSWLSDSLGQEVYSISIRNGIQVSRTRMYGGSGDPTNGKHELLIYKNNTDNSSIVVLNISGKYPNVAVRSQMIDNLKGYVEQPIIADYDVSTLTKQTFTITDTIMTDNNGNVGINNPTPTAALDVNGDIKISSVNPKHVGSIVNGTGGALLSGAESVYISGKYAYVASFYGNALEIVDVSDPSNPRHAGSLTDGTGGALLYYPRSVYGAGKYVYIVSFYGNALEIVDVSNPSNPKHTGSLTNGTGGALLSSPESVYVSGKYAYVATASNNALEIVDVSDPSNPRHAGSLTDGTGGALLSGANSVYVSGKYAYVASPGSKALEIVDVSDPSNPRHVGSLTNGTGGALLSSPESVYVSGKYAYVAVLYNNALEIVDVSDPSNPKHTGSLTNGTGGALLSGADSVYVSGKYAYVASYGGNALEIVDVSDPSNPKHVGSLTNGTGGALLYYPQSVYVAGKYAYVASEGSDSLEILEIPGIDAPSASINSISTSYLKVADNAEINGDLKLSGEIIRATPYGTVSSPTNEYRTISCVNYQYKGDVNNNGAIDQDDANTLMNIVYGTWGFSGDTCCLDANDDGVISMDDVKNINDNIGVIGSRKKCGDIGNGNNNPLIIGATGNNTIENGDFETGSWGSGLANSTWLFSNPGGGAHTQRCSSGDDCKTVHLGSYSQMVNMTGGVAILAYYKNLNLSSSLRYRLRYAVKTDDPSLVYAQVKEGNVTIGMNSGGTNVAGGWYQEEMIIAPYEDGNYTLSFVGTSTFIIDDVSLNEIGMSESEPMPDMMNNGEFETFTSAYPSGNISTGWSLLPYGVYYGYYRFLANSTANHGNYSQEVNTTSSYASSYPDIIGNTNFLTLTPGKYYRLKYAIKVINGSCSVKVQNYWTSSLSFYHSNPEIGNTILTQRYISGPNDHFVEYTDYFKYNGVETPLPSMPYYYDVGNNYEIIFSNNNMCHALIDSVSLYQVDLTIANDTQPMIPQSPVNLIPNGDFEGSWVPNTGSHNIGQNWTASNNVGSQDTAPYQGQSQHFESTSNNTYIMTQNINNISSTKFYLLDYAYKGTACSLFFSSSNTKRLLPMGYTYNSPWYLYETLISPDSDSFNSFGIQGGTNCNASIDSVSLEELSSNLANIGSDQLYTGYNLDYVNHTSYGTLNFPLSINFTSPSTYVYDVQYIPLNYLNTYQIEYSIDVISGECAISIGDYNNPSGYFSYYKSILPSSPHAYATYTDYFKSSYSNYLVISSGPGGPCKANISSITVKQVDLKFSPVLPPGEAGTTPGVIGGEGTVSVFDTVGIGTSTPVARLDVRGNTSFNGDSLFNGNVVFDSGDDSISEGNTKISQNGVFVAQDSLSTPPREPRLKATGLTVDIHRDNPAIYLRNTGGPTAVIDGDVNLNGDIVGSDSLWLGLSNGELWSCTPSDTCVNYGNKTYAINTMQVYGGYLWLGQEHGRVRICDSSGNCPNEWVFGYNYNVTSSQVYNGYIWFGLDNGDIKFCNLTSPQTIGCYNKINTGSAIHNMQVLDNKLWIGTGAYIISINATGTQSAYGGSGLGAIGTISDMQTYADKLWIGSSNSTLVACNAAASCTSTPITSPITGLTVIDDRLYVTATDGYLSEYDSNGNFIKDLKQYPGNTIKSLDTFNGNIVFGVSNSIIVYLESCTQQGSCHVIDNFDSTVVNSMAVFSPNSLSNALSIKSGNVEIEQNRLLKLGTTYISSGFDSSLNNWSHISNNGWYEGAGKWHVYGSGSLMQLDAKAINFYTFDQNTSASDPTTSPIFNLKMRIDGNNNEVNITGMINEITTGNVTTRFVYFSSQYSMTYPKCPCDTGDSNDCGDYFINDTTTLTNCSDMVYDTPYSEYRLYRKTTTALPSFETGTAAQFANGYVGNGDVQIVLKATGQQGTDANNKFIRSENGNLEFGQYNDAMNTSSPQVTIDKSGNLGIGYYKKSCTRALSNWDYDDGKGFVGCNCTTGTLVSGGIFCTSPNYVRGSYPSTTADTWFGSCTNPDFSYPEKISIICANIKQ